MSLSSAQLNITNEEGERDKLSKLKLLPKYMVLVVTLLFDKLMMIKDHSSRFTFCINVRFF
jgi:hypothetical protein